MIQFKRTARQKDGRMEDLISKVSSGYRRGSKKIFYLISVFKGNMRTWTETIELSDQGEKKLLNATS